MYRPVYSEQYSALYFSSAPTCSDAVFVGGLHVFVCGALQDPARMSALLGLEPAFAPAAASGYRRSVECVGGREIPFMVPDEGEPGRVLTGVVWLDLAKASLDRIESLELESGHRRRIAIEARVGELDLAAYSYVRR
jgi:hypothetical protein